MNTPHLINLLPKANVRAFTRDYWFRFATVAVILLAGIVIVNILLLIPAYMYAHAHVETLQAKLATIDQTMKSSEQDQVTTRVANLATEQTYLQRLQKISKAPALLDAVLAAPRPGIALTSFSVTPPSSGDGKIVLNGKAETRSDLRAYTESLGNLPFVSNVDLPISAYANEANINFSITLTGSLSL